MEKKAYYEITGKQDGIFYGTYQAYDEKDALDKMLSEMGVPEDERLYNNFFVEEKED